MKKITLSLQILALVTASSAFAMDFRVGPKIGFGLGSALGMKETDAKIALGLPVGATFQFDFGGFGIDTGLNYRYNTFGFDYDSSVTGVDFTHYVRYSSLELPVTAYAILGRSDTGFFKLGGGAGLDYGFGKVKQEVTAGFGSASTSDSFNDAGLKNLDLYLIAHAGYQWLFDSWALSLDLQPKYGLINKIKDSNVAVAAPGSKWNTLWVDLTVAFLF